ncbi:MAG TPA: hypothetical protein VLI90_08760 [Tepidisphaeraceae bacterium]|nr:hypothetical protein [Tepidisphaeraceae bacterium]
MLLKKKARLTGVASLLGSEQIRRLEHEGDTYFAVADLVALLTESADPQQYFADLKAREPQLGQLVQTIDYTAADGSVTSLDVVSVDGAMRLIQSIPSPRAERYKSWIAEAARQRFEEQQNPELAILRTRNLYESKGYSRPWVDKRLRGVSSRHELTREWSKRGASESDDYRALTNELFDAAFGMDVAKYRAYKGLINRPSAHLRDHMTDLELVLTTLAESAAAILMRDRNSHGMEELTADARDAGEIVARTRFELEARRGRPAAYPGTVERASNDQAA